jgi:hypothetical protein
MNMVKKYTLVIGTLVATLSAVPSIIAQQDCIAHIQGANDVSLAGYASVSAAVTPQGSSCASYQVQTKVSTWIQQVSYPACQAGTRINNVCFHEASAPASSSSRAAQFQSCGVYVGHAAHTWSSVFFGLEFVTGSPNQTNLYAECSGGITASMACTNQGEGYEFNEWTYDCNYVSPIIVALGRNRSYRLANLANGVRFDLNADGHAERTAWTRPGSGVAFLALDRNGNGMIDDGRELFGNFTVAGAANGFIALKMLSDQANPGQSLGDVSAGNALYEQLLLWEDANQNGISDAGELSKFSSHFTSAGLWYQPLGRRDGDGNKFLFKGGMTRRTTPGANQVQTPQEDLERTLVVYDVFFKTAF